MIYIEWPTAGAYIGGIRESPRRRRRRRRRRRSRRRRRKERKKERKKKERKRRGRWWLKRRKIDGERRGDRLKRVESQRFYDHAPLYVKAPSETSRRHWGEFIAGLLRPTYFNLVLQTRSTEYETNGRKHCAAFCISCDSIVGRHASRATS